jgi:hypothetical protein
MRTSYNGSDDLHCAEQPTVRVWLAEACFTPMGSDGRSVCEDDCGLYLGLFDILTPAYTG